MSLMCFQLNTYSSITGCVSFKLSVVYSTLMCWFELIYQVEFSTHNVVYCQLSTLLVSPRRYIICSSVTFRDESSSSLHRSSGRMILDSMSLGLPGYGYTVKLSQRFVWFVGNCRVMNFNWVITLCDPRISGRRVFKKCAHWNDSHFFPAQKRNTSPQYQKHERSF